MTAPYCFRCGYREILASASKPTFNPNNIMDYLDSSNKEFMNQAIQSQYPPGSILRLLLQLLPWNLA